MCVFFKSVLTFFFVLFFVNKLQQIWLVQNLQQPDGNECAYITTKLSQRLSKMYCFSSPAQIKSHLLLKALIEQLKRQSNLNQYKSCYVLNWKKEEEEQIKKNCKYSENSCSIVSFTISIYPDESGCSLTGHLTPTVCATTLIKCLWVDWYLYCDVIDDQKSSSIWVCSNWIYSIWK